MRVRGRGHVRQPPLRPGAVVDVVDVGQYLPEQGGDVRVVEFVDHAAPVAPVAPVAPTAPAGHEVEVAQEPQVVGDGGLAEGEVLGQFTDRAGGLEQAGEDADPGR